MPSGDDFEEAPEGLSLGVGDQIRWDTSPESLYFHTGSYIVTVGGMMTSAMPDEGKERIRAYLEVARNLVASRTG